MKADKTIILLFFLVVLMFGLPHLINIAEHGYSLYNPVPSVNGLTSNLDEILYTPGFRDVIDGHYIVKSPQLAEYKNSTNNIDILPYLVLGGSAKVLGLGVNDIFIISDFIFPALGFLLLYVLMRKVFDIRKDIAVLFSLGMIIFQSFSAFIMNLPYDLNPLTAMDSLGQGKLYPPEFVFLPLIIALIAMYMSFKKEGYLYPLITIISGTALVYSYIFYSTFFWTAFALFSLYMLVANRHGIKPVLKKILLIAIPSAVLSLPFLKEFLAFKNLPTYAEVLLRSGAEYSRFNPMPLAYAAVSAVFLVIVYKLMHKKDSQKFYFVASLLLSVVVWSNIQVIMSYSIQPFHWIYRVGEVLYFILAAYIVQESYVFLKESSSMDSRMIKPIFAFLNDKRFVAVAIIFIIGFGISYSYVGATRTSDIFVFNKSELQLYQWLNNNTPTDSTVLTLSIDQNIKVSSYTHNNVYLANGVYSNWPTTEIEDRIAYLYRAYNATEDALVDRINVSDDAFRKEYLDQLYAGKRFSLVDFEKYMLIHYPFHWQFFYGKWWFQSHDPDNVTFMGYAYPQSFKQTLLSKFLNQSFVVYQHDYLLVGPYERSIINTTTLGYREIYSNDDFTLFSMHD